MSDVDWNQVARDLTNCLEQRNARIRELEAALRLIAGTDGTECSSPRYVAAQALGSSKETKGEQ